MNKKIKPYVTAAKLFKNEGMGFLFFNCRKLTAVIGLVTANGTSFCKIDYYCKQKVKLCLKTHHNLTTIMWTREI